MRFQYKGPAWAFDTNLGTVDITTEAPSRAKAISNIKFRAKQQFNMMPTLALSIDEQKVEELKSSRTITVKPKQVPQDRQLTLDDAAKSIKEITSMKHFTKRPSAVKAGSTFDTEYQPYTELDQVFNEFSDLPEEARIKKVEDYYHHDLEGDHEADIAYRRWTQDHIKAATSASKDLSVLAEGIADDLEVLLDYINQLRDPSYYLDQYDINALTEAYDKLLDFARDYNHGQYEG